MLQNFSLIGRTALITGAAGLMGIEHASALLECGARVVLTDVNTIKLKKALDILSKNYASNDILSQILDVSSHDSVIDVSNELQSKNIFVDILVNNAAIDPKVTTKNSLLECSRLENFPIEQWDRQIAVGLTGAFNCSKVFGYEMARNGRGGVILNIASDLSIISPDQRIYRDDQLPKDMQPVKPVTYSVIKAGLVGLTNYLATYWSEYNVRCNALSPGGIVNGQPTEFIQRLTSLIPLGRMALPGEYRSAVQFLCSDASKYMNGQNIVIDGGRSTW